MQFSFSWLFGFIYFFTLCCGCLFLDHRASRDRRGMVGRSAAAAREYRAASLALSLFLRSRFLLLRHHLFEWMNIPPGKNPVLDSKRSYLNWQFFAFRAVLYFVLLGGVRVFPAPLFRRPRIATAIRAYTVWMRKVAFAGLPLFRSGANLCRFRLADGTELSLVLHHVGRLHFCRRRRQFDVACSCWSLPRCARPAISKW